jgi:ABC-type transporter MlaC component
MPELRRQILRGDIAGAQKAMTEIGMDPSYQRWVVKTTLDPRLRLSAKSVRDFYRTAGPEQRARFDRAQGAPVQP